MNEVELFSHRSGVNLAAPSVDKVHLKLTLYMKIKEASRSCLGNLADLASMDVVLCNIAVGQYLMYVYTLALIQSSSSS